MATIFWKAFSSSGDVTSQAALDNEGIGAVWCARTTSRAEFDSITESQMVSGWPFPLRSTNSRGQGPLFDRAASRLFKNAVVHNMASLELQFARDVLARIIVDATQDILKVPVGALFREGDAQALFVVENGRAHVRIVTIGRRSRLEAEVVIGLQGGELVVAYPSDKVREGVWVQAR